MIIIRLGDAHSVQFIGDFILALIEVTNTSNRDPKRSDNTLTDYRLIQSINPERTLLLCCGSSQVMINAQNPILLRVKSVSRSSAIATNMGAVVLNLLQSSELGGDLCHIRMDSQRVDTTISESNSTTASGVSSWRIDILLIQEYENPQSSQQGALKNIELSLILEWNRILNVGAMGPINVSEDDTREPVEGAFSPPTASLTSAAPAPPVLLNQTITADEKVPPSPPEQKVCSETVTGKAVKRGTTSKKDLQKQEIVANSTNVSPLESPRPVLRSHVAPQVEQWLPPSGKFPNLKNFYWRLFNRSPQA